MKVAASGLLAVVLVACHKEPPPPPPHPVVTTYACRVGVHAHAAANLNVSGSGNGPTADVATTQAWAAACAALPEAQRADCHNDQRFSANVMTGSATANGTQNFSVTVQLSPRQQPDSLGNGTSHTSSDDACHQATEQACRAAGATGDCVAAGTHEEGMRSSSMERM